MGANESKPSKRITRRKEEVCFEQFKVLRAIGRGSFGKVCIVRKRNTNMLYAMKYMNKKKCIDECAIHNVLKERKIQGLLHHNLLVNLCYAFQDPEDLYIVVDLMLGGDLRFHLDKYGKFTEIRVKGYMAELVCAIGYIHSKGIIHRDIKPANILMDNKGHIHLADFNIATFANDDGKLHYSNTGTRHYMAPEMVSRKGYSYGADWWSLGITMYEMLVNKNPIYVPRSTSEDIARNICNIAINYPPELDAATVSLLSGLLERNKEDRLGTPEHFNELKNHNYFISLDKTWEQIEQLELECTYIPSQSKLHCDASYELEELLVNTTPLSEKKKRLRKLASVDDTQAKLNTNYEKLLLLQNNFGAFDWELNKETEVLDDNDFVATKLSSKFSESILFEDISGVRNTLCPELDSDVSKTAMKNASNAILNSELTTNGDSIFDKNKRSDSEKSITIMNKPDSTETKDTNNECETTTTMENKNVGLVGEKEACVIIKVREGNDQNSVGTDKECDNVSKVREGNDQNSADTDKECDNVSKVL